MSEIFLARQPIFTKNEKTYGYELLFRSGTKNIYTGEDAVTSTLHVLTAAFTSFDIKEVVNYKKAFINFPEKLLIDATPKLFPKDILVIEVLEDVEPTNEVIESLKELKNEGYLIALDDFVYKEGLLPLIELADIIKVDFFLTKGEGRGIVIEELLGANPHLSFLAEKVETREEFEQGKKFGYKYFQGYFFTKPVIISTHDVPAYKVTYLRLLKEVRSEDLDFDKVEEIIKTDASLPYKLLKYINSAHFGLKNEIKSLKQALVLLGIEGIRKWLTVVLLGNLSEDKPEEVAALSLLRARFCELLGERIGMSENYLGEAFLIGLFSMIDVMVGRPKSEVLEDITLPQDVKDALLGKPNILKDILDLVIAWEEVKEEDIVYYSEKFKLKREIIDALYWEALRWATEIFMPKNN